uniref:Uncharacterized protein n=1 Tax=Plectus sambesii TaxID=2011161 RepID=A0A914XRI3_9BILA
MQLFVLLLLYAVFADCATTTLSYLNNWSNERVYWYTRAAVELIEQTDCMTTCFASPDQCQQLKTRLANPALVNIYSTESNSNERFIASLPEYELDEHDDFLVIDPFPDRPFGHAVAVFFVDSVSEVECRWLDGNYIGNLGSAGRCVHWAKNKNCGRNRTERKEHRHINGCAINFLPAVFSTDTRSSGGKTEQRLKCQSVAGFARCPLLALTNGTTPCDSLACEHELFRRLEPHCGLFQKCDHAVIVQGGWTGATTDGDRMAEMRSALSAVGFMGANVRAFDKDRRTLAEAEADAAVFPASKRLVRKAISSVCQLHYCVDTFVVVLKAPSLSNGDVLLWDSNGNGRADTDEVYRVSELIEDLSDCGAAQTIVLLDTPHGRRIISAIKEHHSSSVVLAYAASSNYSRSEFSDRWTKGRLRDRCVKDVFKWVSLERSVNREPLERKTIFGAPCDRRLDERHLAEYRRCHSVPTYEFFRSSGSPTLPGRPLRHRRRQH